MKKFTARSVAGLLIAAFLLFIPNSFLAYAESVDVPDDITAVAPEITAEIPAPEPVLGVPTPQTIYIDGVEYPLRGFNIGGSNYFMLRELSSALDGKQSQFDIFWNEE
ncbi:MAG: hypothetical protein LBN43_02215, partial [Oscillospiraceae bacterium]|nr:hypothetical protein [Oscillospiraceae bacterium]